MLKTITFAGIHRDTNEGVCPDGECMQLLNATAYKDGVHMLQNPTEAVASLDKSYTDIRKHEHSGYYLGLNGGKLYSLGAMTGDVTGSQIGSVTGVNGYEIAGNIVCMFTDDGIVYAIYKNGSYSIIGSKPDYARLYVDDIETKIENVTVREDFYGSSEKEKQEYATGLLDKCMAGLSSNGYFIDRTFFRVGVRLFDGSYINVSPIYLVECNTPASYYWLYDEENNDYIRHVCNRDENNFKWDILETSDPHETIISASLAGFKPTIRVELPDLTNWKDIVSGIDVFTTGSLPKHRKNRVWDSTQNTFVEQWQEIETNDYLNMIKEGMDFRLFRTYSLDGEITYHVDDVGMSNIKVQESLNANFLLSRYLLTENSKSYVYNSRLHIANYDELLPRNYNPREYMLCDGGQYHSKFGKLTAMIGGQQKSFLRVPQLDYIAQNIDSEGESHEYIVRAYIGNTGQTLCRVAEFASSNLSMRSIGVDETGIHDTLYAYPADTSGSPLPTSTVGYATKYEVLDDESERGYWYYSTQALTTVHGYSGNKTVFDEDDFYLPLPFRDHEINVLIQYPDSRASSLLLNNNGAAYKYSLGSDGLSNMAFAYASIKPEGTYEASPVDNSSIGHKNTLSVSAIDNPFVFPVSQSYTPDQSAITGLCANSEELGEGQHGDNPMYVFTENATYALFVDKSGKTVYPSIDLVSGDVLEGDIASITDGVVMITKQGAVLLNGKRKTLLSRALDGEDSYLLPHDVGDQPTGGDAMIRKICEVSSLSSLCERSDRFIDYIRSGNCKIGYDYAQRLIYISNGSYGYSYVYNLDSGEWSKKEGVTTGYVRSYPRCMYIDSTHAVYDTYDPETQNTNLVLFSRPIKLSLGLKKVKQFALDCRLRPSTDNSEDDYEPYDESEEYEGEYYEGETLKGGRPVGVFLLGSLDGKSYQLCARRETNKPTFRMVSPYNRTKAYKYFIVCIVGGVKTNTIVNGITLDVDGVFSNRLR